MGLAFCLSYVKNDRGEKKIASLKKKQRLNQIPNPSALCYMRSEYEYRNKFVNVLTTRKLKGLPINAFCIEQVEKHEYFSKYANAARGHSSKLMFIAIIFDFFYNPAALSVILRFIFSQYPYCIILSNLVHRFPNCQDARH